MIILFNKKVLTYFLLIGLSLTILSINISISKADTSVEWSKTFGGTGDEVANCMIKTNDGGYAIAGSATSFGAGGADFWLIKIDENGNLLWNKTYGGTDNEGASSVIQTNDGGYALVGSKGWLLKLDSSGNIQWNQTLRSTVAGPGGLDSIVQTNDGGYAVTGTGSSTIKYLIKTDSLGNQLWDIPLTAGSRQNIRCVIHTNDDGFGFIGTEYVGPFGDSGLYFGKLYSNGTRGWIIMPDQLWRYVAAAQSEGYSVVQTDDGYALVGRSFGYIYPIQGNYSYSIYVHYLLLIKTDLDGNIQWGKTYTDATPSSIIQTNDDGYALIGGSGGDFLLVKTDVYGNFMWSKTYGGAGNEIAKSVVETVDGGFLLAGSTTSYGAGGSDFYLVKTAPTPTTLTVLNTENGIMYPSPGTYIPSELGDKAAWLIAHPNVGYKFNFFLIDGIQTGAQYLEEDGDYTYYLKTDTSHVVQAIFSSSNPDFLTLTVLYSLGGRLYPSPDTYRSSVFGDSAWLIAHPSSGYKFNYFIIDGKITPAQYLEEDGDYTYYLNMNTSHTVQAIFSPS